MRRNLLKRRNERPGKGQDSDVIEATRGEVSEKQKTTEKFGEVRINISIGFEIGQLLASVGSSY